MIWNHCWSPFPQDQREERRGARLAFLWALYYLVVYAVGRNSPFNRQIIWIGVALLGLISVPFLSQHMRLSALPREGVRLGLFLLWSMTGYFVATNEVGFVRYLQILTEFTAIVTALSLVFMYSGAVKWFHLAFLGVAVAAIYYIGHPISMEFVTPEDQIRTEIGTANGLGFSGVLGVFSALALFPETKRLWVRGGIVAGGFLAFYAILLSASRSAFLSLMVIAVLWPALCLISTRRFKLTATIGAGIVLLLAYGAYGFIMQETYLGNRLMQSVNMEDGSTRTRFELVRIGLGLFISNPLFGCGLGQFSIVSGTGHYAHNEFVEIAATTGLPGLLLYYSVYVIAWRRLSRALGVLQDPLVRYRINLARVALLVMVILGLVSTPNFLNKPSMFLLATIVGIAHWAERMARQVHGRAPAGPGMNAAQPGFSGWPRPPVPGGWPGVAGGWGRR